MLLINGLWTYAAYSLLRRSAIVPLLLAGQFFALIFKDLYYRHVLQSNTIGVGSLLSDLDTSYSISSIVFLLFIVPSFFIVQRSTHFTPPARSTMLNLSTWFYLLLIILALLTLLYGNDWMLRNRPGGTNTIGQIARLLFPISVFIWICFAVTFASAPTYNKSNLLYIGIFILSLNMMGLRGWIIVGFAIILIERYRRVALHKLAFEVFAVFVPLVLAKRLVGGEFSKEALFRIGAQGDMVEVTGAILAVLRTSDAGFFNIQSLLGYLFGWLPLTAREAIGIFSTTDILNMLVHDSYLSQSTGHNVSSYQALYLIFGNFSLPLVLLSGILFAFFIRKFLTTPSLEMKVLSLFSASCLVNFGSFKYLFLYIFLSVGVYIVRFIRNKRSAMRSR